MSWKSDMMGVTLGKWSVAGRAGVWKVMTGVTTRFEDGTDNNSSDALLRIDLAHIPDQYGDIAYHFDAKVSPRSEQSLTALRKAETTSASTTVKSDILNACALFCAKFRKTNRSGVCH